VSKISKILAQTRAGDPAAHHVWKIDFKDILPGPLPHATFIQSCRNKAFFRHTTPASGRILQTDSARRNQDLQSPAASSGI